MFIKCHTLSTSSKSNTNEFFRNYENEICSIRFGGGPRKLATICANLCYELRVFVKFLSNFFSLKIFWTVTRSLFWLFSLQLTRDHKFTIMSLSGAGPTSSITWRLFKVLAKHHEELSTLVIYHKFAVLGRRWVMYIIAILARCRTLNRWNHSFLTG